MATEPACLLIADISGYTAYLSGVELSHAEDILADLIGTIVTSLGPGFRLAQLEGDAAFTFALTEKIDGSLLLDTIERCYFDFRRRRRDVRQATSCPCNACVRIPDLNLKFVVHHGTVVRQRVAGHDELLGSDVILVHRLLKNDVVEGTGVEAYALFTQSCVDAMDVDVQVLGMRSTSQTYEHIGTVDAWVHDLDRRWREEEARTRVMVGETGAIFRFEQVTSAPPQLLWEFVTTPGRRVGWQAGVTGGGGDRGGQPTRRGDHEPLPPWQGRERRAAARLAPIPLPHDPQHRPDPHGRAPLPRDHRARAHDRRNCPPPAHRAAGDAQGADRREADGPHARTGPSSERCTTGRTARRRARAPEQRGRRRHAVSAAAGLGRDGRRPGDLRGEACPARQDRRHLVGTGLRPLEPSSAVTVMVLL